MIHFEPFVVESGGQLGEKAQEIFKKICNLITQTTGQSGSSIAYFWRSRLLVTLAKITYSNATRWAMAQNKSKDPDSAPNDSAISTNSVPMWHRVVETAAGHYWTPVICTSKLAG